MTPNGFLIQDLTIEDPTVKQLLPKANYRGVHRYAQDPVMADRSTLYIDDLCVEETCRGKGVGKALYEAACAHGREQSCGSITLNVWCCNEKAMRFYEHLGLVPQKIGMEKML